MPNFLFKTQNAKNKRKNVVKKIISLEEETNYLLKELKSFGFLIFLVFVFFILSFLPFLFLFYKERKQLTIINHDGQKQKWLENIDIIRYLNYETSSLFNLRKEKEIKILYCNEKQRFNSSLFVEFDMLFLNLFLYKKKLREKKGNECPILVILKNMGGSHYSLICVWFDKSEMTSKAFLYDSIACSSRKINSYFEQNFERQTKDFAQSLKKKNSFFDWFFSHCSEYLESLAEKETIRSVVESILINVEKEQNEFVMESDKQQNKTFIQEQQEKEKSLCLFEEYDNSTIFNKSDDRDFSITKTYLEDAWMKFNGLSGQNEKAEALEWTEEILFSALEYFCEIQPENFRGNEQRNIQGDSYSCGYYSIAVAEKVCELIAKEETIENIQKEIENFRLNLTEKEEIREKVEKNPFLDKKKKNE